MENAITIKKGRYETLNYYEAVGTNGTMFIREKRKHNFRECNAYECYTVGGFINGIFVSIDCKDYRSAKQLFMAMQ